ncbi:MAG: hypothetical protein VKK59_03995 [Vampirovibrionales bacterium]|nr:hypothetical protein [Vampirovibrionales bacterium]
MSDYVFKLKKGELELELKSDDARFIETQMDNWRNTLLASLSAPMANDAVNLPTYPQNVG